MCTILNDQWRHAHRGRRAMFKDEKIILHKKNLEHILK